MQLYDQYNASTINNLTGALAVKHNNIFYGILNDSSEKISDGEIHLYRYLQISCQGMPVNVNVLDFNEFGRRVLKGIKGSKFWQFQLTVKNTSLPKIKNEAPGISDTSFFALVKILINYSCWVRLSFLKPIVFLLNRKPLLLSLNGSTS